MISASGAWMGLQPVAGRLPKTLCIREKRVKQCLIELAPPHIVSELPLLERVQKRSMIPRIELPGLGEMQSLGRMHGAVA
jgi:hypothetical protein